MRKSIILCVLLSLFLFFWTNLFAAEVKVSGEIVDGYRIITVPANQKELKISAYRGDYIKFKLADSYTWMQKLSIPKLSIDEVLTGDFDSAPYFKMKAEGTFPFTLGDRKGEVIVIGYTNPRYKEVTAKEAVLLIGNIKPLILDVRTVREYKMGHVKDAILIPVQELQKRAGEISRYKHDDILIYCATGNRSTVASKILIDRGFKRIYNLRNGFYDWDAKGNPIVK